MTAAFMPRHLNTGITLCLEVCSCFCYARFGAIGWRVTLDKDFTETKKWLHFWSHCSKEANGGTNSYGTVFALSSAPRGNARETESVRHWSGREHEKKKIESMDSDSLFSCYTKLHLRGQSLAGCGLWPGRMKSLGQQGLSGWLLNGSEFYGQTPECKSLHIP